MKLENQVTNLELSKKLKDLGVKQESYWYWDYKHIVHWEDTGGLTDIYSAFTVAELGEMLPRDISSFKQVKRNGHTAKGWICRQYNYQKDSPFEFDTVDFESDTEADVRAKMLIYLIENKLYVPTPKLK